MSVQGPPSSAPGDDIISEMIGHLDIYHHAGEYHLHPPPASLHLTDYCEIINCALPGTRCAADRPRSTQRESTIGLRAIRLACEEGQRNVLWL